MTKFDLRNKLRPYNKIIENLSYLSILQLFTILLPFITYPYLFRVLGTELYGNIIYAQAIAIYISIVINFGFNISGAKFCSIYKDERDKLSRIVSAIYISKIIIWVICLLIYMLVISSVQFFKENFSLYFITFFITINELMFPVWFFQGIEKMKYNTIINVSARLLFTVLIFVFVNSQADYLLVPLLNSIGALFGGVLSLFLVFKKEKIKFLFIPAEDIFHQFKEALPLFASQASVKAYLSANKLIVGSFLGMSEVAIYDVGEKVSSLMKVPVQVLNQAVFPKVCRDKNISFINKILKISLLISILMYITVFLGSDIIIELLMNEKNTLAINILRMLSLSAIFSSVNTFLAGGRLIPFGFNRKYMTLVIANSIFFFAGVGLLIFFDIVSIYSLAFMVVSVEVFYLVSLLHVNSKLRILKSE
nr:oligosaccharide flippase family protein [uncultured Draconibacterium sp.]